MIFYDFTVCLVNLQLFDMINLLVLTFICWLRMLMTYLCFCLYFYHRFFLNRFILMSFDPADYLFIYTLLRTSNWPIFFLVFLQFFIHLFHFLGFLTYHLSQSGAICLFRFNFLTPPNPNIPIIVWLKGWIVVIKEYNLLILLLFLYNFMYSFIIPFKAILY